MKPRGYLRLGAALLVLLGLARGAGGVVLLVSGAAADSRIAAGAAAVGVAGVLLLLISLALVVAGVGLAKVNRAFWRFGIGSLVAFVIDGAVNGAVLYGRPGVGGTVANVIVAALIALCLLAGRNALEPGLE